MRYRILVLAAVLLSALAAGVVLRRSVPRSEAEDPADDGGRDSRRTSPGETRVPVARPLPPARVPLEPAGSLHVAGRVLRHDGTPAPRCPVRLVPPRAGPGSSALAGEAMSDPEGKFLIEGLSPGAGLLVAGEPWRTGEMGQASRLVTLEAGQCLDGIELKLPKCRDIRVTVLDARGGPLPGVRVWLPWETEPVGHYWQETDDRGTAVLASYEDVTRVGILALPEDGKRRLLPPEAVLARNETSTTIVLQDAGVASGVVLDPDGEPVPRLGLRAIQGDDPEDDSLSGTRTGADGTFEISLPLDGAFTLMPDFGEAEPRVFAGKSRLPIRVTGSLPGVRAGDRGLVFRLVPEPLDRELRVRVESPTGHPVAGAAIRLFEFLETPCRTGVSDDLGHASFRALPSKRHLVEVSPPGNDPAATDWVKGVVRNVVPAGQEIVVKLHAGFRLSGVVLRPDGSPCEGARVCTVIRRPDSGVVTVGADGRFSFLIDSEDVDPLDLAAWFESDAVKLKGQLRLRDRSVREVTVRLKEAE